MCVTNNAAVATQNLKIAERVRAILPAGEKILVVDQLDVSANPVLDPGESHCYPYKYAITPVAGATGYENRARVTITNDPRGPGNPLGPTVTALFSIPSSPTLINDSINVDDTNGGSWPFSASGSVTYDRTFTCDEDAGEHVNTATIRQTGQSDSAKVTVTCTPPPSEGCTLTQGYWKNHSKYDKQARSHVGIDRRGHGVLPERTVVVRGDQHQSGGRQRVLHPRPPVHRGAAELPLGSQLDPGGRRRLRMGDDVLRDVHADRRPER